MDTDLYLRVRGRVLGPYDLEKLQTLVRRGQLSRKHEVSTDGTHWVAASTYPDLFVGAPVTLPSPPGNSNYPQPVNPSPVANDDPGFSVEGDQPGAAPAMPNTQPSGGRLWYYEHASTQSGPVEESVLRTLLLTGQIDPDALVWNEGMSQWTAASQIPGLVSLVRGKGRPGGGNSQPSDAEVQSLCKAAFASQPWVLFLAITAFIYGGLCVVGGFLWSIMGARLGVPLLVSMGVSSIVSGIVSAIGGILLINYARDLSSLRYRSNCKDLEKSMQRLKTFWMFISIVLIVILAFVGFFTIWIFAIGVSLPNFG
ncbi:MAG: DUF4339 domain-containing protein [Planctomycetota bacterium]